MVPDHASTASPPPTTYRCHDRESYNGFYSTRECSRTHFLTEILAVDRGIEIEWNTGNSHPNLRPLVPGKKSHPSPWLPVHGLTNKWAALARLDLGAPGITRFSTTFTRRPGERQGRSLWPFGGDNGENKDTSFLFLAHRSQGTGTGVGPAVRQDDGFCFRRPPGDLGMRLDQL